jgi:peptide/nickel transport system substrate-binding protein
VHRRSDTRPQARRIWLFAVLAVLAIFAAACGGTDSDDSSGSGGSSSGASDTLRTAFVADMQVPDPDIFYETEGNQVTMSTYEGLVRYQQDPPSNEIEGLLATSWEKSPDGLKYTFTLRPDVKFFDGTEFNSEALKTSFERRTEVDQGPAYMLAEVASYETPDPLTFVVNLNRPVSAFMDYLAAPYGPKAISPTAYEQHKGDDLGQDYLATHSIGTGPFVIKEFTLGQRYVLEANPNYWGDAPNFKTISIEIIPDLSTQQVKLEGGDLDILHNLPAATTNSFKNKSGFQVITIPSLQMTVLKVNPNKPPFDNLQVRQALRAALDKEKLTKDVFGDLGTVSPQMVPLGQLPEFPAGLGADDWEYDPQLLKDAAADLPSGSKSIRIVYGTGLVNDQRIAEAIQQTLSDAGFDVKVTSMTYANIFALRDQPEADVPNLLVETANPDAAHLDTYQRIFYSTGGFLNYLKGGTPAADAEMDRGLYTNDPAVVADAYGKAADLLHDSATFITIADVKGTFVATDKLSGWTGTAAAPVSLNFQAASLK